MVKYIYIMTQVELAFYLVPQWSVLWNTCNWIYIYKWSSKACTRLYIFFNFHFLGSIFKTVTCIIQNDTFVGYLNMKKIVKSQIKSNVKKSLNMGALLLGYLMYMYLHPGMVRPFCIVVAQLRWLLCRYTYILLMFMKWQLWHTAYTLYK